MSSEDPLLALQNAIKSNFPVSYANSDGDATPNPQDATHVRLSPTLLLPKGSPTRFRKAESTATDPKSSPHDFLNLDALVLAWLKRDAPIPEYMKLVRELGGTAFVSITERKGLAEWLEGTASEHERIVPLGGGTTTPSTTPPTQPIGLPTVPTPGAIASPSKRRYVADQADLEAVKKIKRDEIELRDRTTVLRGTKPNNFQSIRNSVGEKLKKVKELTRSGAPPPPVAPRPDPKILAKKNRNNFPIIMISSSPTALITMYNVKRFLQDSIFETSADARARAAAEGNSRAEDVIPIYRRKTHLDATGKEMETFSRYVIVDGVDALKKFGEDPWDRVVCVMTTGQAWQFRPYKWSEPRQLFHHVKGIYVSWSNDPPNTKIKDWNVSEIKIDPHRRHVDKSTVAHFWKMLDSWTQLNKPWLMS